MAKFTSQLKKFGLKVVEMDADGNCLFSSIADQVLGDDELRSRLRRETCDYMEENKELYKNFMENDNEIDDYIKWLRGNGKWGG